VAAARFNGLVVFLIVSGLGSAFLMSSRAGRAIRRPFEGVFTPVSKPARGVASVLTSHWQKSPVADEGSPASPRPAATVYSENADLRAQVARLQLETERLSRLVAERKVVGEVGGGVVAAAVTGVDSSGIREGLLISGSNFPADRPVISGHDLIGRIYGGGIAGAEVRLVTDIGLGFTVRFGKYVRNKDGTTSLKLAEHLQPVARGVGHGQMAVLNTVSIRQAEDADLEAGDVVLLDDREGWPASVQGFKVGHVTSVQKQANAPLFADIRIEPEINLLQLTEVMVVTHE
jgi:cell shape-determining protein MreC